MHHLSGGYGLLPPGYPSGEMVPQSPGDPVGSPLAPHDNGGGLENSGDGGAVGGQQPQGGDSIENIFGLSFGLKKRIEIPF